MEVKLKNGAIETLTAVQVITFALEQILDPKRGPRGPRALFKLDKIAKNPSHQLFGDSGKLLKDLALLKEDGSMYDSVRNIAISSIAGESLGMYLVNPIDLEYLEENKEALGTFLKRNKTQFEG